MNVIFRDLRQVVVDYVRQLVDVEPAGRDIRRNQHANLPVAEIAQRAGTRALALVPMDRGGVQPVLRELRGQAIRGVLGACEHQHLAPVPGTDEVGEQLALARAIDRVDMLRDRVSCPFPAGDLDSFRRLQQAVGELGRVLVEGRGKQQVLPVFRQQRDDFPDIADKAHVEHAVRFVQHQHLDARQVDGALRDVIQQPSGGGNDDVDASPQLGDLRADGNAAVNRE